MKVTPTLNLPYMLEPTMSNIIKLAVIASEDIMVIGQVSTMVSERDYSVIIVKSAIKSILKILEEKIDLLILDLDFSQNNLIDLINIIKRMRPKLPIIVLCEDFSRETIRKFAEAKIFYCAIKPLQIGEMEKVLEAVIRFNQRQKSNGNVVKENF